jgi:hypothetical protein
VCHIISRGYTALMIRRNIVNILTCLRWVWAVYKRGILLLLLLLVVVSFPRDFRGGWGGGVMVIGALKKEGSC